MLCVGITDLIDVLAAGANSRAVPLLSFRIIAVHLDQHGIINALTKAIWHCRQVRLKRKPDTMGETASKILNELRGASWISVERIMRERLRYSQLVSAHV